MVLEQDFCPQAPTKGRTLNSRIQNSLLDTLGKTFQQILRFKVGFRHLLAERSGQLQGHESYVVWKYFSPMPKWFSNSTIKFHSCLLSEGKHGLGGRQAESTATLWFISQCSTKTRVICEMLNTGHAGKRNRTALSTFQQLGLSYKRKTYAHSSCFKGYASTITKSDIDNQNKVMLLHVKKYSCAYIRVSAH